MILTAKRWFHFLYVWLRRVFGLQHAELPAFNLEQNGDTKGPSTTRKPRAPRHQAVAIFQQRYDYSCTASVLQSVHHYLTGEAMSHEEAIRITECKPDGAQLSVIASALRSLTGARTRKLRRMSEARRSLRAKRFVISCDNLSYCDPHAVLLVGSTRAGFYVLDPNTARITWRRDQWVKEAADEFIEVFPSEV